MPHDLARPDAPAPTQRWMIGDAVFCPGRGVGSIVDRGPRAASKATRVYLTVAYGHPPMRVLVPENRATELGLRTPTSSEDLARALKRLGTATESATKDWKRRIVETTVKLRSGDVDATVDVLGELSLRRARKPLGIQEQEQRAQAFKMLQTQLAYAFDLDRETAASTLALLLPEDGTTPR